MKKILLIKLICISLFSCVTENKKVVPEKGKLIVITNGQNTDTITLASTGNRLRDSYMILDTVLFRYYHSQTYCDEPNLVRIDTSEYGEVIESGIGRFYTDSHDYTTTKYNEAGLIKEYRFDGTYDHSFQTNYYYTKNRIDSIITLNPKRRTLISKKREFEKWKKQVLSKVFMGYE